MHKMILVEVDYYKTHITTSCSRHIIIAIRRNEQQKRFYRYFGKVFIYHKDYFKK